MTGVKFTKDAADRTKAAVKKIERLPSRLVGQATHGGAAYVGFWAKITAKDPATNGFKYSWVRQEPTDLSTSKALFDNDTWGKGAYDDDSGYAVEINKSMYVLKEDIVWMYPSLSQEYYLFQYNPGVRIAKTAATEDINAVSANNISSGSVRVWKIVNGIRSDTLINVQAFNTSTQAVAKDTFVQITYNVTDSLWAITWEDC